MRNADEDQSEGGTASSIEDIGLTEEEGSEFTDQRQALKSSNSKGNSMFVRRNQNEQQNEAGGATGPPEQPKQGQSTESVDLSRYTAEQKSASGT